MFLQEQIVFPTCIRTQVDYIGNNLNPLNVFQYTLRHFIVETQSREICNDKPRSFVLIFTKDDCTKLRRHSSKSPMSNPSIRVGNLSQKSRFSRIRSPDESHICHKFEFQQHIHFRPGLALGTESRHAHILCLEIGVSEPASSSSPN